MSSTVPNLVSEYLSTLLKPPPPNDSLSRCPSPVLSILATHPESLIRLARSKLHSWPYSEVPACWRRLYSDASIVHALHLIQHWIEGDEIPQGTTKLVNGKNLDSMEKAESRVSVKELEGPDDWIQDVVRILDMAIIMAGAEGRRDMIESLLQALQRHSQEEQPEEPEPNPKRRKLDPLQQRFDACNTGSLPLVKHQIPFTTAISVFAFEQHLRARKGPLSRMRWSIGLRCMNGLGDVLAIF